MGMHLTSLEWLALFICIHVWSLESISQVEKTLMIFHQHN